VPPSDDELPHVSEIEGVQPGYAHIHTSLPSAQFFNDDAYAQDRKCDKDFDSDLLTHTESWTG